MRSKTLALLSVTVALATADPSTAARRRAWVTSVTGTGNLASWPDAGGLGGLAAGDAICRARAAAAGLPNANAYRVWLSTASTDAYCHVQGLTGKRSTGCDGGTPAPAGPWYRVNTTGVLPATESLDALVDEGVIYRSILYDEFRQPLHEDPPTRYWTGTRDDGSVHASNCTSWVVASADVSGVYGEVTTTAQVWSLGAAAACNQPQRLLCLEPGTSEPTGQKWTGAGSIVFLTSVRSTANLATWPQAGGEAGLAAGDAICRNLAAAAHLPAPDSFFAWLSADAVDAADRLTSDGPFWRIDGVAVASSKADLLDLSNAGSIHQFETGAYKQGNGGGSAWTGTDGFGTATGEDCSGWTSAAIELLARRGEAEATLDDSWSSFNTTSCGNPLHLYCFSNAVVLFWDGFESGATSRWSEVTP
ncbi:MAG: hypothetical protein AMXMBFR36_00380 [Acidobacteriota bacterium]